MTGPSPTLRPPAFVRRPLSPRERQVLRLAANGYTNEQIAQTLGVCRMTVQRHLQNVRAALGARDRTHAVALAMRARAISADDIQPDQESAA